MIRVWPVALAISVLCAPAYAKDPPPPDETKTLAKDHAKFTYLTDGRGHYLIVDDSNRKSRLVYYGDRKNVYRQRVIGFSYNERAKKRQWTIWSPQAFTTTTVVVHAVQTGARIYRDDKKWLVKCGAREAKFFPVDSKTRAKLQRTRFRGRYHNRTVKFFARDDDAVYYLVDRFADSRAGYRLFRGKSGALKRVNLSDAIVDQVGQRYEGKGVVLRHNLQTKESVWIAGKKKTRIYELRGRESDTLIYNDLGVYTRLGTPCDDF